MYIHLQLLDNIRPLWSAITIRYSGAPILLTVNSLLKWRVQLGAHLARLKELIRERPFDAEPLSQCALQRESVREREHLNITSLSASETGVRSVFLSSEGELTEGAGGVKGQPAHTYRKSS